MTACLIQKEKGEFVNANTYQAWRGFDERGIPTSFFGFADLDAGHVGLGPDIVVVGGVGTVRRALALLGIEPPPPLDLPDSLVKHRGRSVWTSSLGEIRSRYQGEGEPLFIKPRRDPKAFKGQVVSRFRDLIATARFPADTEVLVSDCVDFIAEWRAYILDGEVVGIGHYRGEPLSYPDAETVRGAVAEYAPEAPVAYALDFGIASDGRTLLIEANDGYSMGNYGLGPILYSRFLESRWLEMARFAPNRGEWASSVSKTVGAISDPSFKRHAQGRLIDDSPG